MHRKKRKTQKLANGGDWYQERIVLYQIHRFQNKKQKLIFQEFSTWGTFQYEGF